ncbi:MAG: carbohydrate ABC transporter permease [Caldicoprobacterales bacterium]|jgi:ABC-type glycerol-3-phosphate transport system permease component
MGKRRKSFSIAQGVVHLIIWILLFIMLYPLAMTAWNAFKSQIGYEYTRWYPTLPLRVRNIAVAFVHIWRYVLNTLIVAVVGGAGCLFIASLSAYVFARMEFPGRKILYAMVIGLMMIPGVLTLVPSYAIYRSMGLLNNLLVLIIPVIIGGSIFGVFLLNAFFAGLSKDMFEAGQIDGAGDFRCYFSIALPLCLPIMGTLAIMKFVDVWNDYLWPMITIHDYEKLTISAGLLITFTRQYSSNMPVTFSGYLVASVPLILLFIFANRYYVEGLVNSAIKM